MAGGYFASARSEEHWIIILCVFAPILSGFKIRTESPHFTTDPDRPISLKGLIIMWIVSAVVSWAWLGFCFYMSQIRTRRKGRERGNMIPLQDQDNGDYNNRVRRPHPQAVPAPVLHHPHAPHPAHNPVPILTMPHGNNVGGTTSSEQNSPTGGLSRRSSTGPHSSVESLDYPVAGPSRAPLSTPVLRGRPIRVESTRSSNNSIDSFGLDAAAQSS
ncbi:uncharacterized protein JCM6883_005634 [Sporobolomyces salmoneus]|uniref:uncharacterized protein n=1 Tax=Sporobolomyces salmoneus TaxID=183962 RepID=UPI003172E04C